MIELPDGVVPNAATPRVVDFGFVQEAVGGSMTRIERPGTKFEVDLTFPPMVAATARVVVARLARARVAGLRIEYPLLGQGQGVPGNPVVDGTDSAGRVLKLRGMTVGYQAKEGYWLNLTGPDGARYLHQVSALATVDGTGKVTLAVEPPLRIFPGDGGAVELAAPVIEGLVVSETTWALNPGELVSGIALTLREAA